jgi:hypothetical protein
MFYQCHLRWQVKQADAVAVVERTEQNWRLSHAIHAKEGTQSLRQKVDAGLATQKQQKHVGR